MQLDVLDVNKSYGKESILHHIEFSVGSGEIVGLVGGMRKKYAGTIAVLL